MSDTHTHVIVGGGLAGAKTAEALREEGFDGRIVLIGEESERPYERPALSKDYLRGESAREKVYVHAADFYERHDIELRTATAGERVDTGARVVRLRGGERLSYDRLLFATGAEPRRLSIPGAELDGVHYLRDLADADALAARLAKGGKVVVIGAGWIGAEVAASALENGLDVALVARSEVPLERVLGRGIGALYAQLHRDRGVDLHTGVGIAAFEGKDRVERVRLADGQMLDCDFVVVGVGVTPRTRLAEVAGLDVDNGILVDASLETNVPGVFAVGDVANAFHPFYGRHLRVEHWANALHQPATAAQAMLDKPASYERLPYFFSDQYDVGMEYSGYVTEWDEIVFRGDPAGLEFVAFWLKSGRVLAGMNVNVWGVTDEIRLLIESRAAVDVRRLRDPDVPLNDFVGATVAS